MNRRTLLKSSLVAVPAIIIPKGAGASKGWCRMDPEAIVNGQHIAWYGSVWTEPQYITSATFTVHAKYGTSFVLVGTPQCPTTIFHGGASNYIVFNYATSNGDNLGRFEVTPIDSGPIQAFDQQFTGTSFLWHF